MAFIYLCSALFILVFALIYYSSVKPTLLSPPQGKSTITAPVIILVCAFLLRIIVACSIEGHGTDISCFKSWAMMAYEGGLGAFYSSDTFTDYPPGYMYVLWVIGFLRSVFDIEYASTLYTVIVKMPAIICDLVTIWFIYKLLYKKTNSTVALCLSLLYALNPAVVINSAAWAQVDSVFTLFVVLFIYYIIEEKLLISCIMFALGALIKPQTVIFTPILLLYVYKLIFMDSDRTKAVKETIISAAVSIGLLFVLILPFTQNLDFMPVINQYIATLGSYDYASVNAFNVFALFGGIWRDASQPFLFIPYSVWTYIFIAMIVFVCAYVFIKEKGETNLFLLAAFIITAMFTFASKMHERYVFPAMILLLCAFAYKKDLRILWTYLILSVGQFLNTGVMLYQNLEFNTTAPPEGAFMPVVCLINIAAFVMLCTTLVCKKESILKPAAMPSKKKAAKPSRERKPFELMRSDSKMRITRIDAIIMAAVTLVYGVVAFTNLGDMTAPVTHWDSMQIGDGFVYEFAEGTHIEKVKWFTGSYEERMMDMTITDSDGISASSQINLGSVFCWHEHSLAQPVRTLQLTTTKYDTMIKEIAFIDAGGNIIEPVSVSAVQTDCGIANLGDESHIVPEHINHYNGTYFDEIYHARTAYEHINGMQPYENTHPPLGKVIMSLGILIFGMNPFGWRFMGTLIGILMLPTIYLFAKKLFKSTPAAAAAIILFASDFMHFTQTRIATIDVYITFFIILMYYFMYDYTTKSFYDTPFAKTLAPLALSGICMGLGVASKWTGAYAGLGLAVLFFISLGRRIYEYKKVMADKNAPKEQKDKVKNCTKYCVYTVLWCVVFFGIIPVAIYGASYIPYLQAPGMKGIESIIENQASMLSYHSSLTATHPFSSQWYEWPIIARPIWYFTSQTLDGLKMTIAAFGNPFVWWTGIAAFVYCIYKMLKNRSYNAMFLLIAFFAQYLPWVGVSRIVFIYHYFTCVPFVILMIAYSINNIFASAQPHSELTTSRFNSKAVMVCVYLIICIWAFCAFYPALSGMAVSPEYIDSLRLYERWVF